MERPAPPRLPRRVAIRVGGDVRRCGRSSMPAAPDDQHGGSDRPQCRHPGMEPGPDPMAFARRHHNLTTSADGRSARDRRRGRNRVQRPRRRCTRRRCGIRDRTVDHPVEQRHHARLSRTALLMPDGRVLVAGGSEASGTPNQNNAEIYSPPYLFRGARPTIGSVPATTRYGQAFRILTADAGSIAKVSLIRWGRSRTRSTRTAGNCGSRLRRTLRDSRSRRRVRAISPRPVTTWCSS